MPPGREGGCVAARTDKSERVRQDYTFTESSLYNAHFRQQN